MMKTRAVVRARKDRMMVDQANVDWVPPFCANVVEDLECPVCDDENVMVREDSSADPRPAYCGTCHALLEVDVCETFRSPTVR
jgi:hypothetical protein